jgi:hypothetical protein
LPIIRGNGGCGSGHQETARLGQDLNIFRQEPVNLAVDFLRQQAEMASHAGRTAPGTPTNVSVS